MSPKNHRVKFEAERLKDGPITYEIDVAPADLNLVDDPEYQFSEAVTGTITAQLVGTTVLLTGIIKTIAQAPCARCLTGLRVPLQAAVTLVYMQDERLLDPVRYPELYDDNTFWYDGDVVYPAEQLREMLLLQLPSVPHCELEDTDFCPVRQVRIEPMVYGPADGEEEESFAAEKPEEDKSFGAQMKRLRRELDT
jgi:uncharacterized metal-binding protein YceD (DUF177 family)